MSFWMSSSSTGLCRITSYRRYKGHRTTQLAITAPVNGRGNNMMTSPNGNLFRVTGSLYGEFTGHRWNPLTEASEAELWCFFYLRLNKRLSKLLICRWYETPSRSLWRHCNEYTCTVKCWYHDIETLAHYRPTVRGIHGSPASSTHNGPAMRSFDVFFAAWIGKLLNKHSNRT